jgi:hypothetical protein
VGATSGKQSRVEVTDVLGGVLRVALYLICKVDERSMDGYSMSSVADPRSRGFAKTRDGEEVGMKWGGFNRKAEEKVRKLLGAKVACYLVSLAMLGLLLCESFKWRPG